MSLFKVAFLELKGRKVKTLILFLIFTLLFTGMLTALTLLYSTQNSKSSVLENIGATVTLDYAEISSSDRPIFTADIRERLSTVENVIGVNQNYADFAQPLNFENSKLYEGKNPYSQDVQIILILHKTMQSFYGAADSGPAAQPPRMLSILFLYAEGAAA